MQELSWDLVPVCKQRKRNSLSIFPAVSLFLSFNLASTHSSCMFPVAQVLDVSEVNDFTFSFYDRGVASHINET